MPEQPFCLCLAGPNGSGKSTFTKALRTVQRLDNWIDPDVVAAAIKGAANYARATDEEISQIAFETARNIRVQYALSGIDFGFETVYSHDSNLDFLITLRELGYFVQLNFVCTVDPRINVGRVANRVAQGGHGVPEDRIVERYRRSLDLLQETIGLVDRIVLLDNSSENEPGRVVLDLTSSVTENRLVVPVHSRPPGWVEGAILGRIMSRIGYPIAAEPIIPAPTQEDRQKILERFRF